MGAGAGYHVHIKGLELGDVLERRLIKGKEPYEDYWLVKMSIVPGEYEIGAEDYYNDFFWQIHELGCGDEPTARIDSGVAHVEYPSEWNDEDRDWYDHVLPNIKDRALDISFLYGAGWIHVDLPEDIVIDKPEVNGEFYGGITSLELHAPDLADAVNCGYESTFNREENDDA